MKLDVDKIRHANARQRILKILVRRPLNIYFFTLIQSPRLLLVTFTLAMQPLSKVLTLNYYKHDDDNDDRVAL